MPRDEKRSNTGIQRHLGNYVVPKVLCTYRALSLGSVLWDMGVLLYDRKYFDKRKCLSKKIFIIYCLNLMPP